MASRLVNRALLSAMFGAFALAVAPGDIESVKARDPRPSAATPSALTLPQATRSTGLKGSADLVVIVSIDGLRPDVVTPQMQGLHRLYLQGAWPRVARTIARSATLPSHASMVSGVDAEAHGIDFNAYNPDRGNITAPTIFSRVHQAGLPTAMFVGKAKLKHLLGRSEHASFKMGGMLCRKLLGHALPHLQTAERGLVFVHFADPDSAGHRFGWMSEKYVQAVRDADRCLQQVMDVIDQAGRTDRTLLIVTSDHGGHNRSHGTRLDVDQQIPWYAWGAGVTRGRIKRSLHTTDTAATTLAALGIGRTAMQGKPVVEVLGTLGSAGLSLIDAPVVTPSR